MWSIRKWLECKIRKRVISSNDVDSENLLLLTIVERSDIIWVGIDAVESSIYYKKGALAFMSWYWSR